MVDPVEERPPGFTQSPSNPPEGLVFDPGLVQEVPYLGGALVSAEPLREGLQQLLLLAGRDVQIGGFLFRMARPSLCRWAGRLGVLHEVEEGWTG